MKLVKREKLDTLIYKVRNNHDVLIIRWYENVIHYFSNLTKAKNDISQCNNDHEKVRIKKYSII